MAKRIGWIGVGVMGLPMAKNVVQGGYPLLAYDIDPARLDLLQAVCGAERASSAAAVAENSDIVVTMLPDAHAVSLVVDGPDGLLSHMSPGSIWVDMTTSNPVLTTDLAEKARLQQIRVVDAPVGRSPQHAERGELLVITGGDKATLEELTPLFQTMAEEIICCGEVGAAHTMKLVNNLLSGVIQEANVEALAIGLRAGLQLDTMLQIFQTVCVWNGYLAGLSAEDPTSPGWKVSTAQEHMGYVEQLAHKLHVPVYAASLVRERMESLIAAGHGDGKYSSVKALLNMHSGIDLFKSYDI